MTDDAVKESQELYKECLDACGDQRRQIEEDVRFSDPSDPDQWDIAIKQRRENDPGGRRFCLVHDQLGQYVANVAGQVEKMPPALHAIPVGGGADKRTAEIIDGRFRHIEHVSRAQQHYRRAATSAARLGVGYLTVKPCMTDEKLNYQEPRIGSVPFALNVVFDPWSTELDGSDSEVAWELVPWNIARFERKWPGRSPMAFGDNEVRMDAQRKDILLVEEWRKSMTSVDMMCYEDEQGKDVHASQEDYDKLCASIGQAIPARAYKTKRAEVKWRRMSGCDVLDESTYVCDYIGIIPVYGYVSFVDGIMKYCGIPRRGRAPQQSYNYHISELQAYMATAPRTPWIAPVRSVQSPGLKEAFDKASVEQAAVLYYDDVDSSGNPVEKPARTQVSTSLQNHEAGAQQALRDIQAALGMYQSNLGAKSNVISGVAYDAQKEQGETSTAHFPAHLADSISHLGNIVMQMDIKLHDAPRQSPIIGFDQSPQSVRIDPGQTQSYQKQGGEVSVNPSIGSYGVRVVVGAAYTTQRQQQNQALTEIMRSNKELAPFVAPFWARSMDIQDSDKLASVLIAAAPPAVQAIMKPEGSEGAPDPAQMAAENAQIKQGLQEAVQHANEAQDMADKAMEELAASKNDKQIEWAKLRLQAQELDIKLLQVTGANEQQIKALATETVNDLMSEQEIVEKETQAAIPAEPEAEEPQEQAMPEEKVEDARIDEVLQGQDEIKNALMTLIELTKRKRTSVPTRGKDGLIMRVDHTLDDSSEGMTVN